MADLLPCPWCSRAPYVEVSDDEEDVHTYWVVCPCGLEGPMFDTEEDARARWNTRAPNPRLTEARALLTECVAEVEARGVDPSLAAAVRAWLEVPHG